MTKSFHSKSYADFLAVLIAARKERKLTQQTVADRLGKPQSYIAKVEGGERRLDITEFVSLARAMEVDPEKLFSKVLKAWDKN